MIFTILVLKQNTTQNKTRHQPHLLMHEESQIQHTAPNYITQSQVHPYRILKISAIPIKKCRLQRNTQQIHTLIIIGCSRDNGPVQTRFTRRNCRSILPAPSCIIKKQSWSLPQLHSHYQKIYLNPRCQIRSNCPPSSLDSSASAS